MMDRGENTIICDKCGAEIEKVEENLQHCVIGLDEEGQEIQETSFTCSSCGKKYTVIITDRKMRLIIEKRKTIRKKINRAAKRATKKNAVATERAIKKMMAEDESLRIQLKEMQEQLKEKYKEE